MSAANREHQRAAEDAERDAVRCSDQSRPEDAEQPSGERPERGPDWQARAAAEARDEYRRKPWLRPDSPGDERRFA